LVFYLANLAISQQTHVNSMECTLYNVSFVLQTTAFFLTTCLYSENKANVGRGQMMQAYLP